MGKIYDVIQWDDHSAEANDIVVYKHDAEDFNTHTQLIVAPNQEAIFVYEGNMLDTFGPGRHTLTSANLPLLTKAINKLVTGGENPHHSEIYYINKVYSNDLKWGTREAIQITDREEFIVQGEKQVLDIPTTVRAFGLFGAHVTDARRLMAKVSGIRARYPKQEFEEYLRGKIVERVVDLLGKTLVEKQIGILKVASHYRDLSDEMCSQMKPFFEEFGIGLDLFSFNSISAREEDLKAIRDALTEANTNAIKGIGQAASRRAQGYTYQQERGFDVLGAAASNEGASGTMMGAGMGLGMGVGMGGMFGAGMANVAQESFGSMNTPQAGAQGQNAQGAGVCPDCGAPIAQGAKFCGNCGKKLGTFCPKCGAPVAQGAKFCGNCGQRLTAVCPNCGAEVAPGTKFCGNCGQQLS